MLISFTTKIIFILTNKILEYIIIKSQVEKEIERKKKVNKILIEAIHNNIIKTKYIK